MIKVNGTVIEEVSANGTAVGEVYVNDVLLWRKTAPARVWKNAWSGQAYLYYPEFDDPHFDLAEGGAYEYTHTFALATDISGKAVQADAEYNENIGGAGAVYSLTAARDSYSAASNLPWNVGHYIAGTLSALPPTGDGLAMTASSYIGYLWGQTVFCFFTVKNLWYCDDES